MCLILQEFTSAFIATLANATSIYFSQAFNVFREKSNTDRNIYLFVQIKAIGLTP